MLRLSIDINYTALKNVTERGFQLQTTLCLKTTLMLHNAHQPILVFFGRDVAERICYQMTICYPTSPN